MAIRDLTDGAVSGATEASLRAFEKASRELRCYTGDPVASVDQAIAASPEMTMAHALRAWLHLLGTEPAGLPVARESLRAANRLAANEREQGHLLAIGHLAEGRWHEAGRVLEDVTAAWPHDLLALQAGHQIDFFTGDSRMLRDRVARVLPAWDERRPGAHAVYGMYAFGLEETGDYARAERFGRRSVEMERRDTWGWHAVAHVMEMQDRVDEGIAWLREDSSAWAEDSFFSVHNHWHLALYHLERGEHAEVLRLFDGPVAGKGSSVVLELIDASALLWRLLVLGVDVGSRFEAVADRWAPLVPSEGYAFNDCHAMMAFVGSGRTKAQAAVLEGLERAARSNGDAATFAGDVGLPVAQALQAFGEARYADTVRLLRPVRHQAHRFGGSHAQRDILDMTLLEAAIRAGHAPLAKALAAERRARRPESPLAALFEKRSVLEGRASFQVEQEGVRA